MSTTTLHRIAAIGGAALLTLALSAAAAAGQNSGAPTTNASYVPPSDSMTGQSMLELLNRANRDEIRQSRAVAAGTRNPEVRRFAQSMVDDHTAALSAANAIADRLGFLRGDSVTTLSNGSASADSGLGAGLSALGDASADQAYLSSMVNAHQDLLAQLSERKSRVTDPAVRAYAAELQATVERHLTEAKRLQTAPGPRPAGP